MDTAQIMRDIEAIGVIGNIVPSRWYRELKTASGTPNFPAIVILSELVYQYRPVITRDEDGNLRYIKKFAGNAFHASYRYWEKFGLTVKQARRGVEYLVAGGYIKKVVDKKPIVVNGNTINNRQFLIPVPEKIADISAQPERIPVSPPHALEGRPPALEGRPPALEGRPPALEGMLHKYRDTETTNKKKTVSLSEISAGDMVEYRSQPAVVLAVNAKTVNVAVLTESGTTRKRANIARGDLTVNGASVVVSESKPTMPPVDDELSEAYAKLCQIDYGMLSRQQKVAIFGKDGILRKMQARGITAADLIEYGEWYNEYRGWATTPPTDSVLRKTWSQYENWKQNGKPRANGGKQNGKPTWDTGNGTGYSHPVTGYQGQLSPDLWQRQR